MDISNGSFIEEQRKYNEAKIVFSANDAGTSGHPHAKAKSICILTTFTKINSNESYT